MRRSAPGERSANTNLGFPLPAGCQGCCVARAFAAVHAEIRAPGAGAGGGGGIVTLARVPTPTPTGWIDCA